MRKLPVLISALALGACATESRDVLRGGPFDLEAQRIGDTRWQASATPTFQLPLTASASYDYSFASAQVSQRLTQGLSAKVPTPHAPIELDWSLAEEGTFGAAGLRGSRHQSAHARWTLDVDGWSLHGQVGWQPTASIADPWASGASVSRNVLRIPLTASWQPRDTMLAMNFAPHLRALLGPGVDASLSYHWLEPADPLARPDQQVQVGVKLPWR